MSRPSPNYGRGSGRGRGETSLPFHPRGGGAGVRGGHEAFRGGRGRGRGAPVVVEVFRHDEGQVPALDRDVERIENKFAAGSKSNTPSLVNPQRPSYGKTGKQVILWTNYFNLTSQKDLQLHRYLVDIAPGVNGKAPVGKKAKRILQLLLEEHFPAQGHEIATDFKANFIARHKLDLQDSYVVTYRADQEDDTPPNPARYTCRIQSTGIITLSELMNHLTSTQAGSMFSSQEEVIQALNIVLGQHPKAQPAVATIAANRHFNIAASNPDRMSLGGGLQVLQGFFMSVRAVTSRLLVNVQVKNMAFYDEGPLEKIMMAFMHANGPNKVSLLKFLKTLSIDVTHIKKTNKKGQRIPRIKTIQGFATKDDGCQQAHPPIVPQFGSGAKDVQFFLENATDSTSTTASATSGGGGGKKNKKGAKAGPPRPPGAGRYISVFAFFKDTYGVVVKDTTLPVINVGSKVSPSYLPVDVCEVRPGQPAKTHLNSAQTQQMIRFAVRRPYQNAQSIVTSGSKLLGFQSANPTLDDFNTIVTPKLITVPGRVLNPPAIKYSGTSQTIPRFGTWNMQNVQFVTKSNLPSWTYLRFSLGGRTPWRSDEDFLAKLDEFQEKLKELGISVKQYMPGVHIKSNIQQIESEVDHWIHRFAINSKRPKLLFVVVPDGATTVYNRIKYLCDVKEGILNVCVLESKFFKANAQYLANVGLKFNLKLGGRNHSIDPLKLWFVGQKKTMVVGIDVTHPSPGSSSSAPSVAAVVASVDEWLGQWPAEIRIQPARQEMVAGLDEMFKSRLLLWQKHNKPLPENVLVYRDGVSEGQYNIVLDKELPALQAACKAVYPASDTKANKPHISIVIVGKRHNTRFYPTKIDDADRGGNPCNGTVVDRGVTDSHNWDFFLQSHAAIQGTARPTHYYVIYDQILRNMKVPLPFPTAADALEDLTHNMCYLFGRATKAVSICPPAYYADLVCTRARCYLGGLFEPTRLSSSDAGSVGTSAQGGRQLPDADLVTIHPNIKDTMFYM